MKKILLIGSSGYIGSELSNFLSNKGYEINKVDNLRRPSSKKEKSSNFIPRYKCSVFNKQRT